MSNKYSIALITEPYVGRSTSLYNITGVDVFQFPSTNADASHRHVKACILVKQRAATAIGCSQYASTNLSAIQMSMDGRRLFIASAYIEPDVDTIRTIDKLNHFIDVNKGALIVVGADGNGHHTEWGCIDTNERGVDLSDLIASTNMSIANDGRSPTFEVYRNGRDITTIVDITFATNNLIDKITDWHVSHEACVSSDHNAISFKIQGSADRSTPRSSTYLYNNKTANWEKFREVVDVHRQLECRWTRDACCRHDDSHPIGM